ncbi:DUF4199 domain-containing protein [Eisenibacter elegans]|jgi:polyferredoxin|uniref:DUF4199 domain-containing protein n=1 Tax=Eisenibacter elegans TaxID=997 RepID=UPI000426A113|nr:DUF4199 domain-containing protein [Eisenibacter elegans]
MKQYQAVFRFGTLTGLAGAFLLLGWLGWLYYSAPNPLDPARRTYDFFFYFAAVIGSLYAFRFQRNGGYMSFVQGLILGSTICLWMLLISEGALWYFLSYVDIAPLVQYRQALVETISADPAKATETLGGQARYEAVLKDLAKLSPTQLIRDDLFKKGFLCVLLSVVPAILMRKSRPE